MRRRPAVVLLTAAAVGLIFVGLGAASASAKVGDKSSTTVTSASSAPSSSTTTTKPHPFGQTVSALRQAGDHTPAAMLMGKKVPGHNKTSTTAAEAATTTAEAVSPQSATSGAAGDTTDGGPKVSPGNSKSHTPAAVLKGKKVPGQSK